MVLHYLLSHGLPILMAVAVLALGVVWTLRGRTGRPPGDRP